MERVSARYEPMRTVDRVIASYHFFQESTMVPSPRPRTTRLALKQRHQTPVLSTLCTPHLPSPCSRRTSHTASFVKHTQHAQLMIRSAVPACCGEQIMTQAGLGQLSVCKPPSLACSLYLVGPLFQVRSSCRQALLDGRESYTAAQASPPVTILGKLDRGSARMHV